MTFHSIPLHSITIYDIPLHHIALHYVTSHHITSHHRGIGLHYTTLQYITSCTCWIAKSCQISFIRTFGWYGKADTGSYSASRVDWVAWVPNDGLPQVRLVQGIEEGNMHPLFWKYFGHIDTTISVLFPTCLYHIKFDCIISSYYHVISSQGDNFMVSRCLKKFQTSVGITLFLANIWLLGQAILRHRFEEIWNNLKSLWSGFNTLFEGCVR